MSTTYDDIPFDIQIEIKKRIPDVKSLIRCRSVSKPWKSLIDSSKFISAYKSSNHRLLLTYDEPFNRGCSGYVSVDDNDSFPQHNFRHLIPPDSAGNLVGISQGLFCFYKIRYVQNPHRLQAHNYVIVIWNPSVRKSVTFDIPRHFHYRYQVFGFGVCRRTSDPKLVYLEYYDDRFISAEIFTISSGDWKSRSINLPNIIYNNTSFYCAWYEWDHKAVIDGILYLHVATKIDNGMYNRIITFDLTSEEFGEVCLPDKLATRLDDNLRISKLNESLVVLERGGDCESQVCNVWIMENGASNLFKKQFTINKPFICSIRGFRMNGQAIIQAKKKKKGLLQVYDPFTGLISDHQLSIDHRLHFKYSYTESLLLLNHSDSLIHYD